MTEAAALRVASDDGPLRRTVSELVRIERAAAFRRHHRSPARIRVHQIDQLLGRVEECRLQCQSQLPAGLWMEIVRALGELWPELRNELGRDRRTDHVADVLFTLQQQLLTASLAAQPPRPRRLAPIIQLFA